MKRRITLSIAITLSIVAISVTSSDTAVSAQNQISVVGDTGVIKLGPNQVLRVGAVDGDTDGSDFLLFRRVGYTQDACNGGVCKLVASSQTTSSPISLMTGEAVTFQVGPDVQGNGVRVVVLSNDRSMHGNASIVDQVTGAIVTSWSWGVANSGSSD
jgi:hypothetical protein